MGRAKALPVAAIVHRTCYDGFRQSFDRSNKILGLAAMRPISREAHALNGRRLQPHRGSKLVTASFAGPPMPNLICTHVLRFRCGNDQIFTLRTEHTRNVGGRHRKLRRYPVVSHATALPCRPRPTKKPRPGPCRAYLASTWRNEE